MLLSVFCSGFAATRVAFALEEIPSPVPGRGGPLNTTAAFGRGAGVGRDGAGPACGRGPFEKPFPTDGAAAAGRGGERDFLFWISQGGVVVTAWGRGHPSVFLARGLVAAATGVRSGVLTRFLSDEQLLYSSSKESVRHLRPVDRLLSCLPFFLGSSGGLAPPPPTTS